MLSVIVHSKDGTLNGKREALTFLGVDPHSLYTHSLQRPYLRGLSQNPRVYTTGKRPQEVGKSFARQRKRKCVLLSLCTTTYSSILSAVVQFLKYFDRSYNDMHYW